MIVRGSDGIRALQRNNQVIVSKTPAEKFATVSLPPPPPSDPFRNYGFYSYGSVDPVPSVIINSGQVIVQIVADGGGTYASLDTSILATEVDVVPGTTGYIVFKFGQATGLSALNGSFQEGPTDFGGTDHYTLIQIGGDTTDVQSESVQKPDGTFARYAYVWMPSLPAVSVGFYHAPICLVEVSPLGVPAVWPIHVGDLMVPLGYTGKVSGFNIFAPA